jgi:hypothetical protein
MPWIFRYFWFVCAAFMLVNVLLWSRRLAVVVEQGNATELETSQFVRWIGACLVGGPMLFGIVGILANWSSPFCAGFMQFTDVPRTLVSLTTLSGWLGVLWWIWRGGGADFLARVAPALSQRPVYTKTYSPRIVRLVVTAMVLISSVGSILTWRTMPVLPALACQVAPVAG